MLPVHAKGRRALALVYVARPSRAGRAKPGYMELVMEAAREWGFPDTYIRGLERWLPPAHVERPKRFKGPVRKFGEFA
jgi:hypothetical protein